MIGGAGARQGILSLAIKDKAQLYGAYMPYLRGGGIFVPTNRRYSLGDEHGEARLRFAADLLVERAAGDSAGAERLAALFDGINRLRSQLGAPLRHDLVLAGLLLEWRNMSPGAGPHRGRSEGSRP